MLFQLIMIFFNYLFTLINYFVRYNAHILIQQPPNGEYHGFLQNLRN